ncbi:hypothetical protein WJX73_008549 [Symbiochloris irregularis]|uniref:Uncharacterized protein n=1 Tax=Symbiochloris irregularis TaxID=706552 RepID=A0AAW1NY45_9CHLO
MVAGADHVQPIAARIADMSRHNRCAPALLSIGHPSICTAIKAIIVARDFVLHSRDHKIQVFDLTCQPAVRQNTNQRDSTPKPALALHLSRAFADTDKMASAASNGTAQKTQMPVVAGGDPDLIAKILAAQVRERCAVTLEAKGPEATCIAMRAVCQARGLLEVGRVKRQAPIPWPCPTE